LSGPLLENGSIRVAQHLSSGLQCQSPEGQEGVGAWDDWQDSARAAIPEVDGAGLSLNVCATGMR
jgi:hypothetical protein